VVLAGKFIDWLLNNAVYTSVLNAERGVSITGLCAPQPDHRPAASIQRYIVLLLDVGGINCTGSVAERRCKV